MPYAGPASNGGERSESAEPEVDDYLCRLDPTDSLAHKLFTEGRAVVSHAIVIEIAVVEVEVLKQRDDWPSIPGLTEYEAKFATVLRASPATPDDKREQLAPLWTQFQGDVLASAHLTETDKQRVMAKVKTDLVNRLDAMTSRNPFELRSATGMKPAETDDYDFLELSDETNPKAARDNPFVDP